MQDIKIGATYTFAPSALSSSYEVDGETRIKTRTQVTGKIVFINHAHRFFTVEYPCGSGILKESIKF